jgi:hypothetical protein
MDTQEKLEQARALAYEGSPYEVAEMAAREGGEVCAYLSHHARAKFGEGWERVFSVESLVPWKELEAWILSLDSYPFAPPNNTPEAGKRDEVNAWLGAISCLPKNSKERDWMELLCIVVLSRNLVEMNGLFSNLGFTVSNVLRLEDDSLWLEINPGRNAVRIIQPQTLGFGVISRGKDPSSPFLQLHIESLNMNIPKLHASSMCWFAHQLGIKPPDRLLPPFVQIITTKRTAAPVAIPPRGFGFNP